MPSYTSSQKLDDRTFVLRELGAGRHALIGQYSLLIERLRAIVPFDGFSFSGLDVEGCHVGRGVYLATSFSAPFRELYTRENLIMVDPLAKLIREDDPIARWDAIDSDDLRSKEARHLSRILKDHDIGPRTGITLWNEGRNYGAAMFTRRRPFSDSELKTLDLFASALHSVLAKPVIDAVNRRLGLSSGETLCLKLASNGLTSEEIASECPYTVETVRTYLKSATGKLKARNRTHAISEAIRRKIIV